MDTLEDISSQIPSYIFWKDTSSRFLGCNIPFARAAGFNTPSEIRGKTDFEMPWADKYADLYQKGDQQVLEGGKMENIIEPQVKTDGKGVFILLNKVPLLDHNNQKIGIIGSYIEIANFNHAQFENIAFTKKQADCLFYLASGMSIKQIANKMGVSIRTTEYHMNLLKTKLKCPNKFLLISKALELSFIKTRLLTELGQSS